MLFINISNCTSQNYNFYFNTKSNDSFYQDDPQNPVQIFVINNNGKDVDIKKFLKLNDPNTMEPVLNVNGTKINNTGKMNTIIIENKDKEVEKELKVRDDYTLYPGHGYYKYHSNTLYNWQSASIFCVAEGAHLVVINSHTEADLVLGIMKTNKVDRIPVGFYRSSTNSEYVTILGGRVSDTGYVKWYPKYPVTNSAYDCGYMSNDGLLWNYPCTYNYPFICEI